MDIDIDVIDQLRCLFLVLNPVKMLQAKEEEMNQPAPGDQSVIMQKASAEISKGNISVQKWKMKIKEVVENKGQIQE